jgi:hypothetical protein
LFAALGLVVVSASGCRIEAHSQTQFEDTTQPARTALKAWNGEPITINNGGVNPVTGTAGIEVKFSSTETNIKAEANFAAHADDDKKADADATIKDAIATFVIEESANGFNIKCGHGGSHGTASSSGSGCKKLIVTIPTPTAAKPLDLTVGGGNGDVRIGLANGPSDVPYLSKLLVDNNGAGDIDMRIHPVKGSSIIVTGEFEVRVALPSDFSAEKCLFTTNDDDPVKANARVITTDFPGMTSGSAYPAAGPSADAAALLNVQSKGLLSSDTVTITKQ